MCCYFILFSSLIFIVLFRVFYVLYLYPQGVALQFQMYYTILYKLLILTDQNTFMLNRSLSDAMRKRTYTTVGVRVIHISHICLSQAPGASEIFDHHLIDTGERSFYF